MPRVMDPHGSMQYSNYVPEDYGKTAHPQDKTNATFLHKSWYDAPGCEAADG